ncbi:MAG: ABC transporter permease subunit [Burkholderiales bacterium]|nr:ABC transporter permease subunit [Burkholderiales bacterium]
MAAQHRPPLPPLAAAGGAGWDWALLPLVLAVFGLLAYAGAGMLRPYQLGEPLPLSLDPAHLPYDLLRTLLRMALALLASLLFACVFAVLAARSAWAARLLVPLLDILQSIPILGFLSITVTGFIVLFPGRLLGVECAAIFAIFTSQAWNMAFSLYQSMRTVPSELDEAARVFQLSGWQRFCRLDLPFAMPGLVWNMMMSMSGGWFFVVAAEAISVSGQHILLPGIGSYIALAIQARDLAAVAWAILAMGIGIVVVDQLVFRPLVAWADRFRFEEGHPDAAPGAWLLHALRRNRGLRRGRQALGRVLQASFALMRRRHDGRSPAARPRAGSPPWQQVLNGLLALAVVVASVRLLQFVHASVGWAEVAQVLLLGVYTLLRVLVLITLAALVWVPVGVWIGLRPAWAARLQALAQLLAAFPANLMFPLVVVAIVHWRLDPDWWLSPLMVFGTQWYLLFNVIAGASSIPAELRDAADNLGLAGWQRWKRFLLPAVFPSVVTGAITASGGSWNASIVSEYVSWGDTTLQAQGLGAYIAQTTAAGDFPRTVLGIGVMCVFVMGLNRLVWRRLYRLAEERWHA